MLLPSSKTSILPAVDTSQSNARIQKHQKAIPGCQGRASRCTAHGAGEKLLGIAWAPPALCCVFRNGLLGGVLCTVVK